MKVVKGYLVIKCNDGKFYSCSNVDEILEWYKYSGNELTLISTPLPNMEEMKFNEYVNKFKDPI